MERPKGVERLELDFKTGHSKIQDLTLEALEVAASTDPSFVNHVA